jgi:hypothetical protein
LRRAKTAAVHFQETAMSRANLHEGVPWVVAQGEDLDEARQEVADGPDQSTTIWATEGGTHGPAVI